MMAAKNNIASFNIKQEQRLRFWLFQLCGWLPFTLFLLPFFGEEEFLSLNTLLFTCSVAILAAFSSLLLRQFYQYINTKVVSSNVWLLLIVLASLVLALLVGIAHYSFWYGIAAIDNQFSVIYQTQPFAAVAGLLWFVYLFWSALYLVISKQERVNHLTIKQQQLELLVKESKIKSLLEQLNPHFMFNTINNIRSLILQNPNRAREMLLSFSDIMRYQINNHDESLVSLSDELDFVIDYIELNRLQLGKRLNFAQNIDSALLSKLVPRMALQLLVENAIKHSVKQSVKPVSLKITIGTTMVEGYPEAWFISVQNNGVLQGKESDSGIGLKNLDDRLELSFQNNYKLTLTEESGVVECMILFKR